MPCYLFTYHAYRSWMPDRARGYVRRNEGVLQRDMVMAERYEQAASFPEVRFSHSHQRLMIDVCNTAAQYLNGRLHFVATDLSHVHVLASWEGDAKWGHMRNSFKKSMTIALKEKYEDRPWFSGGASRKRVRDQAHFEYLVETHLPKHDGWG